SRPNALGSNGSSFSIALISLIGQGKSSSLFFRLNVDNVSMPEVRSSPAIIADGVVIDPFKVVDKTPSLDEKLFADDLIFVFRLQIGNKDSVYAVRHLRRSRSDTKH